MEKFKEFRMVGERLDKTERMIWLSCKTATFVVKVDENNIIKWTAPIAWKWKLKSLEDLIEAWHIDKVVDLDETKDL